MAKKETLPHQVLIVDDEEPLLLSIMAGFEDNDRFQIQTASNGREAIELIEGKKIDLLVTDLRMPEMDGIELLAAMTEREHHVPNIVMSAFGTPVIEDRLQKNGTLRFLDKPIELNTLEQAINEALDLVDELDGSLAGISLGSFLQLIQAEQKTGLVTVFGGGTRRGMLFFEDGSLLDGRSGKLAGDDAVLEMLSWDNVRISLEDLPEYEVETKVSADPMMLILEGARRKDENPETATLDEVKRELAKTSDTQLNTTSGGPMAGLKDTLKEMADEMDGVLAVQVTGMDGITIAVHNPTGADVDTMSAKFAMVMKLVDRSVGDLQGLGDFEENLVQAQNAWILTRFITPQYYVGITVSREGTLGNVRLVSQKYLDQLRKSL